MYRSHVLVCGGTGCTSSGSAKIMEAFEREIALNGLDQEVKVIVDRAYRRCAEILTRCRGQLELTARYLLDHETMDAQMFAKVFSDPGAEEFLPYAVQGS